MNEHIKNFSDRITVESYSGTEPYLFISYSHADTKTVNKILKVIDKEKYRMWYDDTMEIGDDFRAELRTKIENCFAVLLFVSNSSMNSKFCGMEIITAYKFNKRIYPVFIEDEVEIPPAIKMIFENLQHVKSENIFESDKYLAKLIESLPVETMRSLNIVDGVLIKCKDGSPNLTIPGDVTEIGEASFKSCEKLETIGIGDNVISIGDEAFRGCKRLKGVTFGNNIKKIGESAFRDCTGLTKITVENPEVEIGERAFENCASLSEIVLPAGMAEIYGGVFNSCKSLESITLPEELTIMGESSFADCVKLKTIKVPEKVTKIDDMVFNGCIGLKEINLCNSLTKIGKNAFKDCSELTSITIPDSVLNIGVSPFRGCGRLESINVDPKNKSFKSVDHVLFNKSKSNLICYPACIKSESYDIPDSVTVISDWSFCECSNLKKITVPDSVAEIGEGAFYKCSSLEEMIIPDSVTRIDDIAFRECVNLKRIVIPDSVREFGWGVFNGCKNVVVVCSENSMAATMCRKKNIRHVVPEGE